MKRASLVPGMMLLGAITASGATAAAARSSRLATSYYGEQPTHDGRLFIGTACVAATAEATTACCENGECLPEHQAEQIVFADLFSFELLARGAYRFAAPDPRAPLPDTFRAELWSHLGDAPPGYEAFRLSIASSTDGMGHHTVCEPPQPDGGRAPYACGRDGWDPDPSGGFACYDLRLVYYGLVAEEGGERRYFEQRRLRLRTTTDPVRRLLVPADVGDPEPMWVDRASGRRLVGALEPTMTADGRLLAFQRFAPEYPDHLHGSIGYSYNPTPCGIDGWSEVKPVSSMFVDPALAAYPLAARQLRRPDGSLLAPPRAGDDGDQIYGAYPWLMPDGEGIMFTGAIVLCPDGTPEPWQSNCGTRRWALSHVGYASSWGVDHIDGPVNPWQRLTGAVEGWVDPFPRLTFVSAGRRTYEPHLPATGGVSPHRALASGEDVWPMFGLAGSYVYTELNFDDEQDGHHALLLHFNEGLTPQGTYADGGPARDHNGQPLIGGSLPPAAETPDASGYFHRATLRGGMSFVQPLGPELPEGYEVPEPSDTPAALATPEPSDVPPGSEVVTVPHVQPGVHGKAMVFDGIDDHIEVADAPALSARNAITIDVWAQPLSFACDALIVGKGESYALRVLGDGRVAAEVRTSVDDAPLVVVSDAVLETGEWTRITFEYDGPSGRAALWLRPFVLEATPIESRSDAQGVSGGTLVANTSPVTVGAEPGAACGLHGGLDELSVARIARTLRGERLAREAARSPWQEPSDGSGAGGPLGREITAGNGGGGLLPGLVVAAGITGGRRRRAGTPRRGRMRALLIGCLVATLAGCSRPRTDVTAATGQAVEATADETSIDVDRSLHLREPALLADASIGLHRLMLLATGVDPDAPDVDRGRAGAALERLFESFAEEEHSERAALVEWLAEIRAQWGSDATAWDLDQLPFVVTGVHNRIDLAARVAGCGEIRVSLASEHPRHRPLHLIFLFRQASETDDWETCRARARGWAALSTLESNTFVDGARELVRGMLRPERFLVLESAENLVGRWEWRQWAWGRDGWANLPLFQTVDNELVRPGGPRHEDFNRFVAWATRDTLVARMVEIPAPFRQKSGRVLPGGDAEPIALGRDDAALSDALGIVGCPTCHVTNARFVHTRAERGADGALVVRRSAFHEAELYARRARLGLTIASEVPLAPAPFGPLQPYP
jgi:hypothetical protein